MCPHTWLIQAHNIIKGLTIVNTVTVPEIQVTLLWDELRPSTSLPFSHNKTCICEGIYIWSCQVQFDSLDTVCSHMKLRCRTEEEVKQRKNRVYYRLVKASKLLKKKWINAKNIKFMKWKKVLFSMKYIKGCRADKRKTFLYLVLPFFFILIKHREQHATGMHGLKSFHSKINIIHTVRFRPAYYILSISIMPIAYL